MAALSTFSNGALFKYNNHNYVRTDQTGSSMTKIVCFDMNWQGLVELDETTDVTSLTLTTTSVSSFSVA